MVRNKILALLTSAVITSSLILGSVTNVYGTDSKTQAKDIVNKMTLDEKIGQMLMPDFRYWKTEGETSNKDFIEMNQEVANIIDKFDLGGVILFAPNVQTTEQTAKLTHDLQQVAINDEDGNLPLLITVDQEGGIVTRLGTGTNLPGNMALGATRNEKSSYGAGYVIGRELDSLGINVNFSPSLDVNNNPANPVIGLRSFSSNPDLVAKLGVQMIKGIQSQGVATAAKHFAGHGDTATDSHYGLPVVDKSIEELRKVELKPFQAAIDNGVDMVMTAHIQFPQVEKDTYTSKKDGQQILIPATLSDDVLTGLLREEMKFDGVIITDALNMAAIADNFGEIETVKMAFKAGVDIALMPTILRSTADIPKLDAIVEGVKEAVNSGEISLDKINESATRVVKLKIDRGVMAVESDTRTAEEKIANAKKVVGSKENRDIERRVSAEAITVVKNENNTLPLNPKEGEKVLLVAPYDNELPGMKFGVTRLIAEGKLPSVELDTYNYNKQSVMSEELKAKINSADYVVVISEMGNYSHLAPTHWITAIPNEVTNYANDLNKDSVIVSVGKPYDVAAHPDSKAEVVAYGYKGMDPTEADGGLTPVKAFGPNIPAAMEVIFGGAEAKGTLPVSIPAINEDGTVNLEKELYSYGYGITNLTEVGTTVTEMPTEVKAGEEFEVKLSINEIEGLKSGNYSAAINFNNKAFQVVSVKSGDENLEVKNSTVTDSVINVNLADKSKNAKTKLFITLKSIGEATEDVDVINGVEIIDNKDRVFTTIGEKTTINVVKGEVPGENPDGENKPDEGNKPDEVNKPDEGNKPDGGNNIGNNLPNTGDVIPPVAVGVFATFIATIGAVLIRKKK
jgi:beta-N-acetylhexosaminidase